ncbi:hypothetical protein RA210_U50126 [Rubrivivax sp. A210]|nr:hypothetical protein RA210_U50126 [Rubrivivax sp. A210]
MGLGEVPLQLRQPLDAQRGQHVARHRDLERPERPDRRRAPHHQAQPRLLRHCRFAGRQQHRARNLSPHHSARVPPVPAAPGLRRGHPHPRVPVHRREPGPGRERDLQRLSRDRFDPREGRVPDSVHRRHHGPGLQDRHTRGRPDPAQEPDRLRLPDGRPVLLRRLHANPLDGPPEQDDRCRRAVPVHPARRVHALQLRHRPHQPDQAREPATVDAGLQGRDRGAVREGRGARVPLCRGHHAARRAGPQCLHVQGLSALHRQSARDADRPYRPLPQRGEPVSLDERDDRPQEGAQLLRDPRHRLPDRRRVGLGLMKQQSHMAHTPRHCHAPRPLAGSWCIARY